MCSRTLNEMWFVSVLRKKCLIWEKHFQRTSLLVHAMKNRSLVEENLQQFVVNWYLHGACEKCNTMAQWKIFDVKQITKDYNKFPINSNTLFLSFAGYHSPWKISGESRTWSFSVGNSYEQERYSRSSMVKHWGSTSCSDCSSWNT